MKTVLSFVCFVTIFGLTLSLTNDETYMNECQTKLKATDEDMKVLKSSTELPKTKEQYCLAACYYKKSGIMDENNKLNYEKTVESMEPLKKENKESYDKLLMIIKDCIDTEIPDPDECNSTKKYVECVINKSKESGAKA